MSESKIIQDQLTNALNQCTRQSHHIVAQKNFIDELVAQNLALRANGSILSDNVKRLSDEKANLQEINAKLEKELANEKTKHQDVPQAPAEGLSEKCADAA